MFSGVVATRAPAEGTWRAIQFSPNPAADERLNIGVIFLDKGNKRYFRVLDSVLPIRCLYGSEAQDNFQFVLQLLRESLEREGDLVSPSPQIVLGPPSFAAGEAGQSIVDRLYPEVVTLARHRPVVDDDEAVPALGNAKLRKRVFDEMQRISATMAKRLWAPEPFVVKAAKVEHKLDIPLRAAKRFGSLVSARYVTLASRRNSLLSAFADLATARQFVDHDEKGALFILRAPTDGVRFTETVQSLIDVEVDEVAWRLAKIKVTVSPADSEHRLAQDIINWGRH